MARGRVAGPFPSPPLPNYQVSPIGLVPKKHSTKFRTIFHLSFPKSGETSINSSIPKEDFSLQYITSDNAIQGISSHGQGCFLAKTDIESAFRLIPLRPSDYELFGMYWEGSYYYDKVLPFGLRSAPFLFNLLSDAIEWILLNQCQVSFVCHILDDFLIIAPALSSPPLNLLCQQSLNSMLLTFRNLGIPTAPHKTEGPSTTLEFMGIILDTVRMEARLPADKVERIQASLALFQTKRTCTLKELQSLIGTLNFACKVIPPGRPFLQRMIELTRKGRPFLQRMIELTRKVAKPHHHIKLSKGFFKDLTMWQQFIHTWNGAGFLFFQLLAIPTTTRYDSIMVWAAMTLAFFGFLRLGEMTCNSPYSCTLHLSPGDVTFSPSIQDPDHMTVRIKISKTDPFRSGQTIVIGRTDQKVCPVLAMTNYLSYRGTTLGPLFQYLSGAPLTKAGLTSETRQLLSMSGFQPSQYAGHSY